MTRNWVCDSALSFYIAEANGIFYLGTLYLHLSSFVFRKSRAYSASKSRTDHVIRKLYFCSDAITSLYSESMNLWRGSHRSWECTVTQILARKSRYRADDAALHFCSMF